MSFLEKILGRDDKFYTLLEASAEEVSHCALKLSEFLEGTKPGETAANLAEFNSSRRKDKGITKEITRELCRTFVTPLEREDIEGLSISLYKIPKTVQKIIERLMICPPKLLGNPVLRQQAQILAQSAKVVVEMVKLLRPGTSLEVVAELNGRLQQLEGEADKLVVTMLRQLYEGNGEARDIILVKDISELIERAVDRCRDAGNRIFQVVLKGS